jgi:hypothetical protein
MLAGGVVTKLLSAGVMPDIWVGMESTLYGLFAWETTQLPATSRFRMEEMGNSEAKHT